jgi:hypothetical protein
MAEHNEVAYTTADGMDLHRRHDGDLSDLIRRASHCSAAVRS